MPHSLYKYFGAIPAAPLQEAVRGDHGEVANLLIHAGGKVLDTEGRFVDLAESRLVGNVRLFDDDFNPEWEVDPADLELQEKLGTD